MQQLPAAAQDPVAALIRLEVKPDGVKQRSSRDCIAAADAAAGADPALLLLLLLVIRTAAAV